MGKTVFIYILVLLALSMPLAACGVKPDSLEPPQGAENIKFPRTYPDPMTDPPPYRPPPVP